PRRLSEPGHYSTTYGWSVFMQRGDTAGLLRWEVWRAKPSKKLLFCFSCGRLCRPHEKQKRNFSGACGPRTPTWQVCQQYLKNIWMAQYSSLVFLGRNRTCCRCALTFSASL